MNGFSKSLVEEAQRGVRDTPAIAYGKVTKVKDQSVDIELVNGNPNAPSHYKRGEVLKNIPCTFGKGMVAADPKINDFIVCGFANKQDQSAYIIRYGNDAVAPVVSGQGNGGVGEEVPSIEQEQPALTQATGTSYEVAKSAKDGSQDKNRINWVTGGKGIGSSPYSRNGGIINGVSVEIVSVSVKIWGYGDASKDVSVKVNSKIAQVIKDIFNDIYNHPSKPIIEGISDGGRAYDASPNHPFGVAIDINPTQNPFIKWNKGNNTFASNNAGWNFNNYKPSQWDGKAWIKDKSVNNVDNGSADPLSLGPNHPITQIFEKYGWYWGGRWNNQKDFMHFSLMGG